MDWAKDYYTQQSRTFASAAVSDQHRMIAQRLDNWCRDLPDCKRVLELGAGQGGTAAALSDLGYEVWAVEFNPADVALARELAADRLNTLTIVEGDFYEVTFDHSFDFVYYWDGFGIGSDDDQRRLLRRIANEWLSPTGLAMIDVFSPWNWMRRNGETSNRTARDGAEWTRTIEFDTVTKRLLDHWQPASAADDATPARRTQSIRCYTLPEFELLVDGTGLRVRSFIAMDGRLIECGADGRPCDPDISRYLAETNGYFALLESA